MSGKFTDPFLPLYRGCSLPVSSFASGTVSSSLVTPLSWPGLFLQRGTVLAGLGALPRCGEVGAGNANNRSPFN